MPAKRGRPAEGPRLIYRADRGTWSIHDGAVRRSTGCGRDDRACAERALATYIAEKHEPGDTDQRDPSAVPVADAINLYLRDCAPHHSRPHETAGRAMRLLDFWGDRTIADVTSATCRAYAAQRPSTAGARRDLEDLRGALNHYMAEVFARPGPPVRLPPKPAPRDRWLESGEAARLIWTAWRYREVQKGMTTQRRTRQHIARFAIVALYTGSRAGAICSASFERMPGRGYVDLESGLFYRRPEGEAETNKRKPTITLPRRLLAHMRRWRANGQTYVVEFGGKPVARIGKAFRHVVADSGLGPDVTPHVLRHTAITWAMREGMRPWKAAGYFGLSVDMIDRVYGHHSPDGNAETGEAITRRGAEKVRKLSAITA